MKQDNRGLSLLEVIIAFTLLAMVSTVLVGFMTAGSNMYRNISGNVSLQMQAQVAAAQLKEYIIDCNNTIEFTENVTGAELTVKNTKSDGTPEPPHVFEWTKDDGTITYNGDEFANDVTAFRVTHSGGVITVVLAFEKNGKTQDITQAITLRNQGVLFNPEP